LDGVKKRSLKSKGHKGWVWGGRLEGREEGEPKAREAASVVEKKKKKQRQEKQTKQIIIRGKDTPFFLTYIVL